MPLISSTFPALTFAISGDQITVDIPDITVSAGEVLTASFNATSTSAVPEPSTYGFMMIGFGVFGINDGHAEASRPGYPTSQLNAQLTAPPLSIPISKMR